MRRAVVALVLTAAGLVPLLRYHPSTPTAAAVTPAANTPSAAAPSSSAPSSSAPSSSGQPTSGTRTVTGSEVQTEFGPYQVQATFNGHTITDVQLVETPSDRRSQFIAESAAPTLRQEALQAQSAKIDTVSGATATSEAYAQSLQAAIDAAA
ncbi:FMN-binding protein [Kutzneria sp. CA-103260]|uniref:FMN-binding protein n=1 Tax=Kutzneria sp. CA-103260 TaxID=2802641 RepID=UPI001BA565DE|nr:FMN-binding protein [Kutzneria sp. CA-103260]QUQ67739.1 FMN-binding protein [Kutzneria sp. CA-103260]